VESFSVIFNRLTHKEKPLLKENVPSVHFYDQDFVDVHPHVHKSEKGEVVHIHKHDHSTNHTHLGPDAHRHTHLKQHRQNVKASLGIGIFHGLAGVSHLLAILPTLALPDNFEASMYLTGFAAGTISAMVLFSALLGFVSEKTSATGRSQFFLILRICGGAAAICVGLWWIYSTF